MSDTEPSAPMGGNPIFWCSIGQATEDFGGTVDYLREVLRQQGANDEVIDKVSHAALELFFNAMQHVPRMKKAGDPLAELTVHKVAGDYDVEMFGQADRFDVIRMRDLVNQYRKMGPSELSAELARRRSSAPAFDTTGGSLGLLAIAEGARSGGMSIDARPSGRWDFRLQIRI